MEISSRAKKRKGAIVSVGSFSMSRSEEQRSGALRGEEEEVRVEPEEEEEEGMMEEEDEEEDEGEEEEEDAPLIALAPDASLPEERRPSSSRTANCACPDIQCVDELLSQDQINGIQAARLKSIYRRLQNALKSKQESELLLLAEAKRCRAELEGLRAAVRGSEERWSACEPPDSEAGRLRLDLLNMYNNLKAAEAREHITQYQLESLQEEKRCLEREYESQPKPVELESRATALKDGCEELRRETTQRRLEVKSLQEDMEAHEVHIHREQKELEDKNHIIDIKQAEIAHLLSVPPRLLKEIDRKTHKKLDAQKQVLALKQDVCGRKERLTAEEARRLSLEEEIREARGELRDRRARLEAWEREQRRLLKEQQDLKEREVEHMGERGLLEMKMTHTVTDFKLLHECHSRQLREKNSEMQVLKQVEQAVKQASDQLEQTQSIYNNTRAQRDALPKVDGGGGPGRRKELEKEIQALKASIRLQLPADVEDIVRQKEEELQALLSVSGRLRAELHHLDCLTSIKTEERNRKHRDMLRAEQRKQQFKQELREKELVILEQKKLYTEQQRRLSQVSAVCKVLDMERCKYMNLRRVASQNTADLTEKLELLDHDTEVLHTVNLNKNRLLARARLKHTHSLTMRDSLRTDISKVTWRLTEARGRCEEHRLDVVSLTHSISCSEQAALDVRRRYEEAIQRRNQLGVQVLEREEEVCILYERHNVQEEVLARGHGALEALQEDIAALQLLVTEERRRAELTRRRQRVCRRLEEQLATLQIELSEVQDRVPALEEALSDPNHDNRSRELKGSDPTTMELLAKMEQLEVCLAEREEQLLEKELLLDQVTRLSQPVSEQVDATRLESLPLARKLNDMRRHVDSSGRRMKAVVAELSMTQASALSLQQDVTQRHVQVESCRQQLDMGGAPCPSMEEEWRRMLRNQRRGERDRQERERLQEEEERRRLPNGGFSAAERRPDAYIPPDAPLPLPRPYGALAPFKPSEQGSSMRHIRKPKVKPALT